MTRALAALAIGAAAVAGVGACAPINTSLKYSPSDGSRVELGDALTVSNLLVLTTAVDEPALVVGGLTNHTDENTSVTLDFATADGASESVDVNVAAGSTTLLDPANPDGKTVILQASPVAPGATLSVTVSTASAGTATMNVTVLDGTLDPYGDYLEYLDGAAE